MNRIRWATALPAGLLVGWTAAFIIGFFGGVLLRGAPIAVQTALALLSYSLMGFAATWTAARIAPMHRKTFAWSMWVLLLVFLLVKSGGRFAEDVAIMVGSYLAILFVENAAVSPPRREANGH